MYGVRPQGGRERGREGRDRREGKAGGETWPGSKKGGLLSSECSRCGGPACLLYVDVLDTWLIVPLSPPPYPPPLPPPPSLRLASNV